MIDMNPVGMTSVEFLSMITNINIENIEVSPPVIMVGEVYPDDAEVEANEFYHIYYREGAPDALIVAFDVTTNIFTGLVTVPADEVLEFDEA